MNKAFVRGNENKVAGYLADKLNFFDGSNKEEEGSDKASFLKSVENLKDNIDYESIKCSSGSYFDTLEPTNDR